MMALSKSLLQSHLNVLQVFKLNCININAKNFALQILVNEEKYCQAIINSAMSKLKQTEGSTLRVWHAGLLHKLQSYGISGQIFGLLSSFLSNRRLRVVLDGKSSH